MMEKTIMIFLVVLMLMITTEARDDLENVVKEICLR